MIAMISCARNCSTFPQVTQLPVQSYVILRNQVKCYSQQEANEAAIVSFKTREILRAGPLQLHRDSKKGATLTMAITLSIFLIDLQNSFTAAKSSKFPTKPYYVTYLRSSKEYVIFKRNVNFSMVRCPTGHYRHCN